MRIAYVVHQFLPRYFTGTEQYAFAVADEMARRGHDVAVFTLDPAFGPDRGPVTQETEEVQGLPVTRLRYWMRLHRDFFRLEHRHPLMGLWFGRWLERVRPDVIHVFHLRHLGANLLAEARERGVPTVVHLMDFWFLCPAVVLTRRDGSLCQGPPQGGLGCVPCMAPELAADPELPPLVAALHQAHPSPTAPGSGGGSRAAAYLERPAWLRARLLEADCILSPSRFVRSLFARNGYPEDRIEMLPYGVDRARLRSAATPARPRTPPVLAFVGSLAPHKGLHVALEAFAAVRGDARLQVWGRDADFADYVAPLRERAAADPRIEFRGPFLRDDLGRVLEGVDALLVPSLWYENTPFVVLEAFAAGVPVLASDLGGLAEIVRDGENGELFPRGDAAELTRRLERLVAEPDRLRRYAAGIGPVRSLGESADVLEQRYRALAAAPAGRA